MSSRAIFARTSRLVLQQNTNVIATRSIAASAGQRKTVTESVKDAANTVDRTVSDVAIKGLEGLEKVNEATKDAAQRVGINLESSSDPLDDIAPPAKGTEEMAREVKESAKGRTKEAADKIKDAATE